MAKKHVFSVREITNGVLVGLTPLIKRLPIDSIVSWRFREVELMGVPFEIPYSAFERIMSSPCGAITVPSNMFNEYLKTDFQIIDGYIDAFVADSVRPVFTLEAFDTSIWLIHTESDELAAELEQRGFQRDVCDGC